MTVDEKNKALSAALETIRPRVLEILGRNTGLAMFAWDGQTCYVSFSDNVKPIEVAAIVQGMVPVLIEG